MMWLWTIGALGLAAVTAETAPPDLSWVPPPHVGVRAPALLPQPVDRALVRQRWCSFADHAQRWSKPQAQEDVIFRRPTQAARTALQQVREALVNPDDWRDAEQAATRFATLAVTYEGPALVRLALQDPDDRVQLAALRAAVLMAAKQPRIAAFATGYLTVAEPSQALAAVDLHFATHCDTPALYAVESLRHPDERVQLAVLRQVWQVAADHESLRLPEQVAKILAAGAGTPRTRVIGLRIIGLLGTEAASTAVAKLLRDRNEAVAAEALATLAVLQPGAAEVTLVKGLKDKSPLRRTAALRAFAQVYAGRIDLAEKHLRPMLNDAGVIAPAHGILLAPGRTVGDIARQALAYVEMP